MCPDALAGDPLAMDIGLLSAPALDRASAPPDHPHHENGRRAKLRRILVPVESLDVAMDALATAAAIAGESGSQLRLIHVRIWDRPTPQSGGRFYPRSSEAATATLDEAMQFVWQRGAASSGVVVDAHRSTIATAVLAETASWDADAIVLPAPARNVLNEGPWDRALRRVKRRAGRTVLVAERATIGRSGPSDPAGRID